MSLSTFHQRVSRAIKRGNVFDADIPGYARDAVRSLEDYNNWKHMWVEEEVALGVGASSRTIDGLKMCRFVKRKTTDGLYLPLKKVIPDELLQIGTAVGATPGAFWMESREKINFDAIPTTVQTLRYGYYLYSDYDDFLPWLNISENLLIGQTILEMSPILKDDKITGRYAPIVQAKIAVLEESEADLDYDGMDSRQIPYADEMEEYLAGG